jgi:hypothetical protein
MLKLLYQNEFACGHIVSDAAHSLAQINAETAALSGEALEENFFESIGNGLCRLYLHTLQQSTLAPETLNQFLLHTARKPKGDAASYVEKAKILARLCQEGALPFEMAAVSSAIVQGQAEGYPPFRHSEPYRQAYKPAYRVVDECFCRFLPLFYRIDAIMKQKEPIVIAIDGNSAAGKSTLAALLHSVYDCNVISTDDFFLQPYQRTLARLAEPGGFIDYERFEVEVIAPLSKGISPAYRKFDCRTQTLSDVVQTSPKPLCVIEGAYSLRPQAAAIYDLKIFLRLDVGTQSCRIKARNPNMVDKFLNTWIPLENQYFAYFDLVKQCDLVFDTGGGC